MCVYWVNEWIPQREKPWKEVGTPSLWYIQSLSFLGAHCRPGPYAKLGRQEVMRYGSSLKGLEINVSVWHGVRAGRVVGIRALVTRVLSSSLRAVRNIVTHRCGPKPRIVPRRKVPFHSLVMASIFLSIEILLPPFLHHQTNQELCILGFSSASKNLLLHSKSALQFSYKHFETVLFQGRVQLAMQFGLHWVVYCCYCWSTCLLFLTSGVVLEWCAG